jgi:hypothetical protein
VEVDDDDRRLRARLFDERVHDLPGRHRCVEEERSEQVDGGDLDAVPRLDDGDAAAGRQRAGVGGTDDAVALLEVRPDPVAAKGVVPERDQVGTRGEQPVGELRRDAGAVRDVLAVDDARVDVELFAQSRQARLDRVAARDAEDVGEKENSQLRTSDTAGRSSTETWLPASFV